MGIQRRLWGGASLAVLVAALLPASVVAASPVRVPSSIARSERVVIRWSPTFLAHSQRPDRLSLPEFAAKNAHFLRVTGSGATVYTLDGPLGQESDRVLEELRHLPGVASVEPDLWMTAAVLPNDQYASQLWGLLGPGDAPASPYGIDAQTAWAAAGTHGAGVTVAVVDTGITAHPDLAGQAVGGYDFVDASISHDGNGWDADPSDPGDWCGSQPSSWHGTHVAGTIAALEDNSIGVFGGAPDVKILPVRVLGTCGGYDDEIADGIRWAAGGSVVGAPVNTHPAKVINLSLGGDGPCVSEYATAISEARGRGAVVVVAAGNSTDDAVNFTPANCAGTVTVGAIDQTGDRASFSNYGRTVDISAPGDNILSTVNAGTTVPAASYTYAPYRGTSMATPHVVVTAALIAAANPSFTPDQIETVLLASATPFPDRSTVLSCVQVGCGVGIVNAGRAMTELASGLPVVGPVVVSNKYPAPGGSITVSARLVDTDGIASAEVRVGSGTWTQMNASDGLFGSAFETATLSVAAPSSEGSFPVCLRAKDTGGDWSDGTACSTIGVDAAAPTVGTPVLTPSAAEMNTPVEVTATATDGLAVARGEVRVDSGGWAPMAAADGTFDEATEGLDLSVGLNATSIGADYHSCAAIPGGELWCWGANDRGEIGDGTYTFRSTPVQVPLTSVTAVATGAWSTCALLADKTVRCWGRDDYGQLGDGGSASQPNPVDPGLSGVVSISAAPYHTCAVLSGGTVRCWGLNDHGQLGDNSTVTRRTPVAVSDGAGGQLSGAVAVAAGTFHTCALLSSGAVRCWGANDRGQLGDGTLTERHAPAAVSGLASATAIGAGNHSCALLSAGTVSCWGPNDAGQLGDTTYTDRRTPVTAAGLTGATAIAVGLDHTCSVTSAGAVYCWGYNGAGELGFGNFYDQYYPKAVPGLTGATRIGAGVDATCAIVGAGAVSCWGYNLYGNLGSGGYGLKTSPASVAGFGALNGGTHTICVRATDTAGRVGSAGCTSIVVSGPPGAPSNVTAARGDGQATVSWSASTAYGHPVTGYLVASTPGGKTCTTTTALTCLVTGLTNGTAYTFKVVATSAAGNSQPSAASNSVTPAGLPGKPGGVTGRRDDQSATITWSAAAANGSAITTYAVIASDGVHGCSTSALSCTVTGLTNGVSYTFTVRATNGVGTGPASDPSSAVVPAVIIVRYSGPDRFATAADTALKTFGANCGCVVYVTNYTAFADALAAASAASKVSGPVLLVTPAGAINSYTDNALKTLKPTKIIVVGGTGSVPATVYNLLKGYQPNITRYGGADRFEMAKNVAVTTFGPNCGCTVYISNSTAFTDALAGAAAASKNKGPILLVTATGAINANTVSALKTLLPKQIVVLGGTGSVSPAVYGLLATYAPTIGRYSGVDRFQSAANTATGTFGANCGCVVYIANSTAVADALAGAAAASKVSGPILFVTATGGINSYTDQALKSLKPTKIIVLGGTGSVSAAVYDLLKPYAV